MQPKVWTTFQDKAHLHFFTYNDSVGERFYLKTRRLRQSSSIDRWFLKQNIYLDLFTNKATNISEKKIICFVYKGGPLTGKLKKKLYNIAFGKKNISELSLWILLPTRGFWKEDIYFDLLCFRTKDINIIKGHVFRNAFRRPIHSKKCKNLPKSCKSTETKIVEIRTTRIRIWLKAYHGELVDKKNSSKLKEARTRFSRSHPYVFDTSWVWL